MNPPTVTTINTSAVVTIAITYNPAPHAVPSPADTQITAAVVNPLVSRRFTGCRMTPAPRNPIPVTIPCTVRSAPEGSLPAIDRLASVNNADPNATMACVRIPADLRCRLRLRPTTAPSNTAIPKRSHASTS